MIPLAKDTREAIGVFAEGVQNRSLLFEKMVLSKTSLHDIDRFDDAARFNVLRATHDGRKVLAQERDSANRRANRGGRNVDADRYKSKVAGALANVTVEDDALAQSRIDSANRFILALETSYQGRARTFAAQLGGRLLINMAGGVMENAGIALDRLTGLPFLPGSAVKGVARHQALWSIRRCADRGETQRLLLHALAIFGYAPHDIASGGDFHWAANEDSQLLSAALDVFESDTWKGVCSFLPARPTDLRSLRIVAEVLTSHLKESWINPVFFPAVNSGSEFGFALLLQRDSSLAGLGPEELLDQARTWLRAALTEGGIGAKTGAGYGWFETNSSVEAAQRKKLDAERTKAEEEKRLAGEKAEKERALEAAARKEKERKANLSPQELAREEIAALDNQAFNDLAKELADQEPHRQRAFLEVLSSSAKKERRKQWKKKKADLWAELQAVAKEHNLDLS